MRLPSDRARSSPEWPLGRGSPSRLESLHRTNGPSRSGNPPMGSFELPLVRAPPGATQVTIAFFQPRPRLRPYPVPVRELRPPEFSLSPTAEVVPARNERKDGAEGEARELGPHGVGRERLQNHGVREHQREPRRASTATTWHPSGVQLISQQSPRSRQRPARARSIWIRPRLDSTRSLVVPRRFRAGPSSPLRSGGVEGGWP